MNVSFACPECGYPCRVDATAPAEWQCPGCDHRATLPAASPTLDRCTVCGCTELYKQKDFPHRLGMAILVGSLGASIFSYLWYQKWLTWVLLLGSAAIDGILYLCVGDAFVCYRCESCFRKFPKEVSHAPFELTVGERYRQERLRRQHSTPPRP